jgi:hypothetical protein
LLLQDNFDMPRNIFLKTRGLNNRMLALCEVYFKLMEVILLEENRNQIIISSYSITCTTCYNIVHADL